MSVGGSKLRIGPGVKVLDEPLRSIAEFETWRHSVLYNLRLDGDFKSYISIVFGKKDSAHPSRSLVDDTEGAVKKTKEEKCADVDFMLSQIVNFCPKIPHNDIMRDCASLDDVWQVIRMHSNIETSGALLNDTWNIVRQADERPLALWSRLKQAYDDNLIMKNSLIYKNAVLTADEELSPTLHCTIILHWLNLLHPRLRDLVTQRFATELRGKSYAALFPEISRSVESMLAELREDASVCRYGGNFPPSRTRGSYSRPPPTRSYGNFSRPPVSKFCEVCKIQGRKAYQTHSMEECLFLKRERERSAQSSSYARGYEEIDQSYDEHYNEYYDELQHDDKLNRMTHTEHVINRINLYASPHLILYHQDVPLDVTLDTGGTCNAVSVDVAKKANSRLRPTYQGIRLADGQTKVPVHGETDIALHREGKLFKLTALVAELPTDTVLAGMPFLALNDVGIRSARSEITIYKDDGSVNEVVKYDPHDPGGSQSRRMSSYTLHSPTRSVILPGEVAVFPLPSHMSSVDSVAVEPRTDSSYNRYHSKVWPEPQIQQISDGRICIPNKSADPILVKKHEQICIIQPQIPDSLMPSSPSGAATSPPLKKIPELRKEKLADYSSMVQLNPDSVLSKGECEQFSDVLKMYDEVFNPTISTYNGKSGTCMVEVNMGPHPPVQRKGRLPPFYGRDNLEELQCKFDELVEKGVFKRPQDLGVTVENINPSFLVKKKSSTAKRLVTDFGSIASYCRPTPSLMSNCEGTIRSIGSWAYIILSDFTESYWQMKLKRSSMKYCGVVSPMKGVYVYTVGCMGLPGTEVALEELTNLLFGELIRQGRVAKLADDIFIGGSTVEETLNTFEEVLGILQENNLRLSAKKTVIAPRSVDILGWRWTSGYLQASPHKLSPLSECDPPESVSSLKSYLGAYRFLSRVVKNYASLLHPLEAIIAGKLTGATKIEWSDQRLEAFRKAQAALKDTKAIVLPRPGDTLWIVTDAAARPAAIGATLYAVRGKKTLLAGFYNVKLPPFQQRWLPCELEGVAIGASLKHFAPLIMQSGQAPYVLTDSKACIDAVEKYNRGEYSMSARLCTFLSYASQYRAVLKHISGSANCVSDFISRNPLSCSDERCQICKFVKDTMSSVVGAFSVKDVLEGTVQLPFTNQKAWLEIQEECHDLRRVRKYILNGTSPGKKGRNMRIVKRYISSRTVVSSTGALVVRHVQPLGPATERIVIPQQVLHGILTVFHLRLNHPTSHQLAKVVNRYFFALNMESAVNTVTSKCHQCSAIKEVPHALVPQSTEDPPDHFGQSFAADVVKRHGQKILVLRECVSSYTLATFIQRETAEDTSAGLIQLSNLMRPSPLCPMVIRVDPAASHKSLFINSDVLKAQNIRLEIGRVHNPNKNPVAEKAIRELIREILLLSPDGTPISPTVLSQAVANLNTRLRSSGLSGHEVFTQRDQASGYQVHIQDAALIANQHRRRLRDHGYSEQSKAHNRPRHPVPAITVGSLVYLYSDYSKLKARQRYLVTSIKDGWCQVKRLSEKLMGSVTYSVKLEEVYKVQDDLDVKLPPLPATSDEDTDVMFHVAAEKQPAVESEKFPCSVCQEEVTADHNALLCDNCSQWCHTGCCGVSDHQYAEMSNQSQEFQWACPVHLPADEMSSGEEVEDVEACQDPVETQAPGGLMREARPRRPPDRYTS